MAQAGPAAPALPPEVAEQVMQQVVSSLKMQWKDGVGEAKLHLRPDALGSVSVSLRVEAGAVTAVVRAEISQVQEWVLQHQQTLRQQMEAAGLHLDELVVSPDDQRQQAREDSSPEPHRRRQRGGARTDDGAESRSSLRAAEDDRMSEASDRRQAGTVTLVLAPDSCPRRPDPCRRAVTPAGGAAAAAGLPGPICRNRHISGQLQSARAAAHRLRPRHQPLLFLRAAAYRGGRRRVHEQSREARRCPRQKKGKLPLIIGLVVLLAGGGGGGYWWLAKQKAAAASERRRWPWRGGQEGRPRQGRPRRGRGAAEGGALLPLDVFTVNLADTDAQRFLRTNVQLVIDGDEAVDQGAGGRKAARRPRPVGGARPAVVPAVGGIATAEGKDALKKAIAEKASKALHHEVLDVLFSDFVIQF